MKKTSKIISLILSVFLVLSIISITVSAAEKNGVCGAEVVWTYDDKSHVLTLSGKGDTYDYDYKTSTPFESFGGWVEAVYIEDGITSIGDRLFTDCSYYLETITIPDSVTRIGELAFFDTNLKSVVLPDSVTEIGSGAFYSCNDLESITIPDGITKIDSSTFRGCEKLESITIPDGVTEIGMCAFSSCANIKSITIPDSVTKIGDQAFYGCTSLESITIPAGVTSLTALTIPTQTTIIYKGTMEQWESIKDRDFYHLVVCSDGETHPSGMCGDNLKWEYLHETDTLKISGTGEMYDYALEPDGWDYIDTRPWSELEDIIKVVEIEEGVTSIGYRAFADCRTLVEAQIPSTVIQIGADAFEYCESLKNITIPDGVIKIGGGAFSWSGLESVVIPDSVTKLNSGFSNCSKLKSVVIGEGITKIGDYEFEHCESLSTVEMSNNVTEIGKCAFEDCTKLSKFRVSTSLNKVKTSAFNRAGTPSPVFSGTKEDLLKISVDSGNSRFVESTFYFDNGEIGGIYGNGSIWYYDEGTSTVTISGEGEMYNYAALHYPGYKKFSPKNTVFVDGVRSISNCPDDEMQTLVLADSVQVIHFGAFSKCENLSRVYYAGSKEQWERVEIYDDNAPLLNAEIIYNSCITHQYTETSAEATCTQHGYTRYTCEKCGRCYNDYTSNPTGHTLNEDGVCEVCGEKEVVSNTASNNQFLGFESILQLIMNIIIKIFDTIMVV